MAAPIYCTHKELKRVFPQLDSFDGKKQIYGWATGLTDFFDTSLDCYYKNGSGLVTQLFWDGAEVDNIAFNTTETTQVKVAITPEATSIDLDDTSSFGANDIIKINNEYIRVVDVTDGDTLSITVPASNRGIFGTTAQHHAVDSSVYKIIDADVDLGDASSAGIDGLGFTYDSNLDLCILVSAANPNDYLVEAGEDFTQLVTQFRTDASRYLDSMLDPNMPKEAWKDKNNDYDYIIIRTTALIAANFMIKSHDPNSELANVLMQEAMQNIENINQGKAALSWQTTRDSSQGVVRDVVFPTSGNIRPIDTRGEWRGSYDLIKVIITTGGVLGTSKYSVYVKDDDKLKNNLVVENEVINGDYQQLAGGLQIRFAGADDSSVAVQNNEWEIEVFGAYEETDSSTGRTVKMTRYKKYGTIY